MTRLGQRLLLLNSVGLLGLALTTIGCDNFAATQRQVIGRNSEWAITGSIELKAAQDFGNDGEHA